MKALNFYTTLYICLRRSVGIFLDSLTFFDHIFANRKNGIVLSSDFKFDVGDKIAIYVTHGALHNDSYEEILFDSLRNLNFVVITIVNQPESCYVSTLKQPIFRENLSADLGAVRDFFAHFGSNSFQELFIFNSSMAYLKNVDLFLGNVRQEVNSQIVLGVQSFQKMMHFQSFFFYARGSGIQALSQSFQGIRNYKFKRTLINFGEIGISRKLLKSNIRLRILYPYEKISGGEISRLNRMGIAKNPSIDLAERLLDVGAPFVKRRHPGIVNYLGTE